MYIYANARNCIERLKKLGCDIDADMERRLLDEAKVHHLLAVQMKRVVVECREYYCENGHAHVALIKRPRRKIPKGKGVAECPDCGARWTGSYSVKWWKLKDGSVRDRRTDLERIDGYACPKELAP